MKKNRFKIISLLIVLGISIHLILLEYSQSSTGITSSEFHESVDDESIVKLFKSKYQNHWAGAGHSFGLLTPSWGYQGTIQGASDRHVAELRHYDNFGQDEFIYTCGTSTYVYVRITNPTVDDLNNYPCW